MPKRPTKAILLPGNGVPSWCTSLDGLGFYTEVASALRNMNIDISLRAFPEGELGPEAVWKAFAVQELGLDSDTLLIGHSTGAVCAMRLMEEHITAGVILIAAYHTDLDDATERASGYFGRPWNWTAMRQNTPWVLQFHSRDDPLVPFAEAEEVAESLGSDFRIATHAGHFNESSAPYLVRAIREKIETVCQS